MNQRLHIEVSIYRTLYTVDGTNLHTPDVVLLVVDVVLKAGHA